LRLSFQWLKAVILYKMPSISPPLEAFAISELNLILYLKYISILHQVASFFEVSSYTTLSQTLVEDILDVWILDSAARNLSLKQDSPTTDFIV
jgi:hypothetical protein